ncbi:MAG: hypothetical protein N2316_01270 [Spirochaetes bacterium]|nr:hypothetical protein [Spirochaetota bacterium]
MKLQRIFTLAMMLIVSMPIVQCASESEHVFQINDPEPPFRLFDILDGYPALHDAVSNLDQTTFNHLLADIMNSDTRAVTELLRLCLQKDVIPSTVVDLLNNNLNPLLNRIINQDNFDHPSETYNNYANDLYSLLDKMSSAGRESIGDLIDIVGDVLGYIFYVHGNEIETVMSDIRTALTETEGQTIKSILPLLNEAMGKMLMRTNTTFEVGGKDSGLGNAVRGMDALLAGINDVSSQDEGAREALYDIIRELSNLFSVKDANGYPKFPRVLKDLMITLAEYTTEGGIMTTNNNYYNDDGEYFVNMELRNAIRGAYPAIVSLMLRAKPSWDTSERPDFSIIADSEGRSPLELLSEALYQLKKNCQIDFKSYTIEDSLKRMVQYNCYGLPRSSADYKVSFLDHLLFTLIISNEFGFKTRLDTYDGEPYINNEGGFDEDNRVHSHGEPTGGILTVNDSLYSMTSKAKHAFAYDLVNEYLGVYDLSLDPSVSNLRYTTKSGRTDQAKNIFRSSFDFTSDDITDNKYRYYMGYDFPALLLMNGFSVGDAGIPNGGYSGIQPSTDITGADESNNDYRTYYPYVANGIGELNTGAWVMGWIARVCWEGEGPYYYAPTNPETRIIAGKQYYVYYRPDGRVYAFVWKPDLNDPSTWEYFYPYDGGNDAKGTATLGIGSELYYSRENYYRAEWQTDRYLLKGEYANSTPNVRYYTFDRVVGKDGTDKYLMYKINDPKNPNDDIDAGVVSGAKAGYLTFRELIPEKSAARECKSPEEAMFRNFQWLLLEKKIVCIMPMRSYVYVHAGNIHLDPLAIAVIEANGVLGMSNLRKGAGVGVWVYKGDEGLENTGCTGMTMNGEVVNYGTSSIPGDGRLMLFVKEDARYLAGALGDFVNLETIWNDILGSGSATPPILARNLAPIGRMAFLQPDFVPSSSADIGNQSSPVWNSRNKLLPVVIALAGALHGKSYYKMPDSSNPRPYWYNFAEKSSHKYPLRKLNDLLTMLATPYYKYVKAPYSGGKGRWVPSIAKEDIYGYCAYLAPDTKEYNDVIDYRPNPDLRSMAQLFVENSKNQTASCDGLLPLLAESQIVSKLLAFLQNTGSNTGIYADKNPQSTNIADWGAKRKIFYGLEQIITSVKTSKGIAYQRGYVSSSYPDWMFTKRNVDVDLDVALDELVGADSLGKGLAVFVDFRNPEHKNYKGYNWLNYYKLMYGISELFSKNGKLTNGKYNITDDVIDLLKNALSNTSASANEMAALRHTLAMLFIYYQNGEWREAQELTDLLTEELPRLMDVFNGRYFDLLKLAMIALEENGLVDYIVTNVHTDYPWQQVINELYAFLSSTDNITGISNINSVFWNDVEDLLVQLIALLDESVNRQGARYSVTAETLNSLFNQPMF